MRTPRQLAQHLDQSPSRRRMLRQRLLAVEDPGHRNSHRTQPRPVVLHPKVVDLLLDRLNDGPELLRIVGGFG
jgi:hypothetical protein